MILLDLIFPPRCAVCHEFVKNGKILICDQCKNSLPFTTDGGRQKTAFVSVCVAPLYYEKDIKDSLHRFKFLGCPGYARVYAPYVAETILHELKDEFDVLTWVPISQKRKHRRGYDQAALLARAVGKELGVRPVRTLKKIRNTPPQSLTGSAEKRKANVSGAYRAYRPDRFAGKRVLILDDIFTTGATVSECARTLRKAGADKILCATIARSKSGGS